MIKKRKRISTILLAFIIVTMTVISAFAYDDFEWSTPKTFSLKAGSSFTTNTTTSKLSYYKDSQQETFYLYTLSKTMWTYPGFRAVDNKNNAVSDMVAVPDANDYNGYSSIWGAPDHTYYASLKPAFNQIGTDTIRLKIDLQ